MCVCVGVCVCVCVCVWNTDRVFNQGFRFAQVYFYTRNSRLHERMSIFRVKSKLDRGRKRRREGERGREREREKKKNFPSTFKFL